MSTLSYCNYLLYQWVSAKWANHSWRIAKLNLAPFNSLLVNSTRVLNLCAELCTIAKPTPNPWLFNFRISLVLFLGKKMLSSFPISIPKPSSSTLTITLPPWFLALINTFSLAYTSAFLIRLSKMNLSKIFL